jgi:hypothetical protein
MKMVGAKDTNIKYLHAFISKYLVIFGPHCERHDSLLVGPLSRVPSQALVGNRRRKRKLCTNYGSTGSSSCYVVAIADVACVCNLYIMNRNRYFVSFNVIHLVYIILLSTSSKNGTTWCFSVATKLDVGSARGIPHWLSKSQRQQSLNSDNCRLPPSKDISFSLNSTSCAVPTSKKSEEITNIVIHKMKETVSHTGTFTSLRMIGEQFARQLELFSERTFERIGERTAERTMKRATERTLERVAERTYERVGERAIERTGERVLERTGERFVERTGERALERVGERVLDQVGKKSLIKQSEKKLLNASIFKVRRVLLGKSAIRVGRTLTIALPLLGGLFALYLFQSDVQRMREERRKQLFPPLYGGKKDIHMNRSLNLMAVSALLLFISTGLIDLLDAIVHFWIAYGLLISHYGNSSHHMMERISMCCAIFSTIFAILGEVCSYLSRNRSDSRPDVATGSS